MTQLSFEQMLIQADAKPETPLETQPDSLLDRKLDIFLMIAILFNLCLVAQLLSVGFAVFMDPSGWQLHRWFVRGYGGLAVLLSVGSLLMPYPARIRALSQGALALLVLQFATIHIHLSLPLVIFHPLIGFSLFTTSTTLVHRLMALKKEAQVLG